MNNEIFRLMGTVGVDTKEAKKEVEGFVDTTEKEVDKIPGFFKTAAIAIGSVFAIGKLIDFTTGSVEAAAGALAIKSQFTQVFGDTGTEAQTLLDTMATSFGMLPNRLIAPFTTTTSMFKGLGLSTEEAMGQAQVAVTLAADAAAFYDKSYEDANGSLSSFIKGNYEGGEAIGLFANETQLASWASQNLGLEFSKLSEADKQMTRLKFAQSMQEAAGATGQAARESDSYQNKVGNMKQAWTDFKTSVGEPILPIVIDALTTLSGWLQTATDKVKDFTKWAKDNKTTIELWGVVIGTITTLIIAYNIQQALVTANTTLWGVVSSIAAASTTALATAFAFLVSPVGLIILAIAGLIALGVILYNNWDGIKTFLIGMWDTISNAISVAWESIKNAISAAWDFISAIIQVALMLIVEIVTSFIELILAPWRFLWENLKQFIIPIWDAIKGIITGAFDIIKGIIDTAMTFIKDIITGVWQAIVDFLSPIINGIKDTISNVFESIKTTISNIINGIKDTITLVFNTIKDFISDKIDNIRTNVTNIFNKIRDAIQKPVEEAKDFVKKMIDKILGIFNFKWELPKLKLPHFNIEGKFSLSPPSIPKFNIDWYKEGGILTAPTVFGASGQSLMAGGEAGREAVLPLNKDTLGSIGDGIVRSTDMSNNKLLAKVDRMIDILRELVDIDPNYQIVLDTGILAGELTPKINSRLGQDADRRKRGG